VDVQTHHTLAGEQHLATRIVSLDALEARPITKGKSHPSCEFGTTIHMTCTRQGCRITTENVMGQPNDTTLYAGTRALFRQRMGVYPDTAITDLGYRRRENRTHTPTAVNHVCMGRSDAVSPDRPDFCRHARSATAGFMAVANNRRGFGCSLYRGLTGDRIWTRLCQAAYNLQKFLQRYQEEAIAEKSVVTLGFLTT
jgi:hypothetical protein